MQNTIVKVSFEGDELDAVRDERGVWVSTRRVCEALGVDPSGQRQKLGGKSWAVAEMVSATAADGKRYETHCLHLDALPMWLATIDDRRVAEHVRPKLAKYQRECARVLRDHFFGAPIAPSDVAALTATVAQLVAVMGNLALRVSDIEERDTHGSVIADAAHRRLRAEVTSIAKLEVAAGRRKSVAAARRDIDNEMGDYAGWGGKGQPWRLLPVHLEHLVGTVLRRRRADVERVLIGQARQRQLPLLSDAVAKPN